MPKMKSHKGLSKRFKVSANGKVRYNKSGAGHLMSGKSAKSRRAMRKNVVLNNKPLSARIRRLIAN